MRTRTTWFLDAKASEVVQVEKGREEALDGARGDGQRKGARCRWVPGHEEASASSRKEELSLASTSLGLHLW